MALFKITSKKSGSFSGGIRLEKGMSVEVIDNNNPLGTTKGREKVREAIKVSTDKILSNLPQVLILIVRN